VGFVAETKGGQFSLPLHLRWDKAAQPAPMGLFVPSVPNRSHFGRPRTWKSVSEKGQHPKWETY